MWQYLHRTMNAEAMHTAHVEHKQPVIATFGEATQTIFSVIRAMRRLNIVIVTLVFEGTDPIIMKGTSVDNKTRIDAAIQESSCNLDIDEVKCATVMVDDLVKFFQFVSNKNVHIATFHEPRQLSKDDQNMKITMAVTFSKKYSKIAGKRSETEAEYESTHPQSNNICFVSRSFFCVDDNCQGELECSDTNYEMCKQRSIIPLAPFEVILAGSNSLLDDANIQDSEFQSTSINLATTLYKPTVEKPYPTMTMSVAPSSMPDNIISYDVREGKIMDDMFEDLKAPVKCNWSLSQPQLKTINILIKSVKVQKETSLIFMLHSKKAESTVRKANVCQLFIETDNCSINVYF